MKKLLNNLLIATIFAFFLALPVKASTIYNSIDNPLPGSYPSVGFEATSTFELGDQIGFSGSDRILKSVEVTLTNWACENDFMYVDGLWIPNRTSTQPCLTTPGSKYKHMITLNIYKVNKSGEFAMPGDLIISKEVEADIFFRPSYDPSSNCATPENDVPFGGTWYDSVEGKCVHGYNQNIKFDFTKAALITMPDEVIFGVAFNTADYGLSPLNKVGPYNSLNYGLSKSVIVGIDVEADTAFMKSTWAGNYCDSGITGTFRRDAGCWSGYVPTAKFEATNLDTLSKDQCKDGGWKLLGTPTFKNQGACVSYYQANVHANK